jgi:hypothetical protein
LAPLNDDIFRGAWTQRATQHSMRMTKSGQVRIDAKALTFNAARCITARFS